MILHCRREDLKIVAESCRDVLGITGSSGGWSVFVLDGDEIEPGKVVCYHEVGDDPHQTMVLDLTIGRRRRERDGEE